MSKDELYSEFDLVQDQLNQIYTHRDVLTDIEVNQLKHDCQHINNKLEMFENKTNDKLVHMFRYFKHKFSVLLKALSSRYTDKPIYFSKIQLMNPDQYVQLVT